MKLMDLIFHSQLDFLGQFLKPFNPMIGELFYERLKYQDYEIIAQSEQIINHPSTTLYKIELVQDGNVLVTIIGSQAVEADVHLSKVVVHRSGLNYVLIPQLSEAKPN